ncbi:65-kDa microtubule-associated protein 1-like [Phalaenopsis equestris]|uniref:65-kDa microtubule-associated protein 1-like n=1 Tax=Phalaenopsis equestris TaxID=78828 RepID=UPI0009E4ADB1|nr:65-kDa microtubule-associated protein 1-like [Phalaenopsis equestris]
MWSFCLWIAGGEKARVFGNFCIPMDVTNSQDVFSGQNTCGALLQQLQVIWDEVGESEEERDKMLLQLEQECLDVYMRKVDQALKSRALLLMSLADSRAELASLLSALGENTYAALPDKSSGTIKEQLAAIAPTLQQLCKQKEDRLKEFTDVQLQIQKILREISGNSPNGEKLGMLVVDQNDLSLQKLDEFHVQLQDLQREKSERLHKVLDFVSTVHDLCAVLGMDFFGTITEIHPSLNESIGVQSKSISNDTLYKLFKMVESLKEDKRVRLQKLQVLAARLTDLWNLMDTSSEERELFRHITSNISATVDKVIVPGALALDIIEQAEEEVERLDKLKASRMKEIAMKKQAELEEIYAHAHMDFDSAEAEKKIVALIEFGNVEPSELFVEMDDKILKAKEEALNRREILEKVEKWMSACEEESWLDDYNRIYHGLVETLVSKTRAWEEAHGIQFTYDGVSLLAMLDEYTMLRHDREEEKRRQRDQKRFHEQLTTEQEALFGSKPSPVRSSSMKKMVVPRANGGSSNHTLSRRLNTHHHHGSNNGVRSVSRDGKRDNRLSAPANYVAIAKEDAATTFSSGNDLVLTSP